MPKDYGLMVEEIQQVLKEKTKRYAFKKLDREIIQTGACVECGSCVTGCPVDAISGNRVAGKYVPQLTGDCISCGICYAMCPRTHALDDELVGNVISAWKVRAHGDCKRQDGGAVTAILKYLLKTRTIDGAVVACPSKDNKWLPEAKLIEKSEDLNECGGTIYTHAQVIASMMEGIKKGLTAMGVVGTACNIDSIHRLEIHPGGLLQLNPEIEVFKISLFCMESFNYDNLRIFLSNANIDIDDVKRFAIAGGELTISLEDNEHRWPIGELDTAAASSCFYCQDLTGVNADISCGNIGSGAGWTSVFVRTKRGETAMNGVIKEGLIEAIPLEAKEIQAVINSARFKKNKYYKLSSNPTE